MSEAADKMARGAAKVSKVSKDQRLSYFVIAAMIIGYGEIRTAPKIDSMTKDISRVQEDLEGHDTKIEKLGDRFDRLYEFLLRNKDKK